MKHIIVLLFIMAIIVTGCSTAKTIEKSKNLDANDAINDCVSSQSGETIACNAAVDIVSASIEQNNGIVDIEIELVGEVPPVNKLKEVEVFPNAFLPEIYQYEVWAEINGKWSSVLFGDRRADTKETEGGCGTSYLLDATLGSCQDSQVEFSINKNIVKIKGPLNVPISKFRVTTLYESGSLDKDNIIDTAESN